MAPLTHPPLVVPFLDLPPLRFGPLTMQPFGMLVCVGIIVGWFVARWRARQVGLDVKVVRDLARLCVVFGIFGAHLVHLFAYHPEEFQANPWSILKIWEGMSSYGGMFSAAIAMAIYLTVARIPFLPYADVLVFAFPHIWFFGRLGCTFAHDHPGHLSTFLLAVKFPDGSRHDLGFYEWLLCFFWVPLVHWIGRKKKVDDPPPGTMLHVMLVAYSIPRFFLDFLRAQDIPYHDVRHFGLTPAQYACIVCTVFGMRFLMQARKPLAA